MHRTGISALVLLLSVAGLARCAEKAAPEVLRDLYGDPLPPGAIARMGSLQFHHNNGIRDAALSPDGKTLAGLGAEGTSEIYIWDVATGRLIRRTDLDRSKLYLTVTFCADGKTIAVGSGGPIHITLIDSKTGKELRQLRVTAMSVWTPVAFGPDARCVASPMLDGVHISDTATGKNQRVLQEERAAPQKGVAYWADGKALVSVDEKSCVRVWDVAAGKVSRRFTMLPQVSEATKVWVCLSKDGTTAAYSTPGSYHVWDVESGKERLVIPAPKHAGRRCFLSGNGQRFAYRIQTSQMVVVVDTKTGKSTCEFASSADDYSEEYRLTFSHEGKVIGIVNRFQRNFQLWDAFTGKELARRPTHLSEVHSVTFSPSGRLLASVGGDATLRVWDAAAGRQLQQVEQVWDRRAAFTPDGGAIMAMSDNNAITKWDIESGEVLSTVIFAREVIGDFLISSDRKSLLVETNTESPDRRTFRLFDLASGKPSKTVTYEWERGYFLSGQIAFTPDSSLIAVAESGTTIHLLEAPSLKEVRRLEGSNRDSERRIHAVAFSPDGQLLATCFCDDPYGLVYYGAGNPSRDHTIQLWDVSGGRVVLGLAGHTGSVLTVAFSPDGRTVATGSKDGTIRMWEVASGKELARFSDEGSRVFHVAFSPDGQRLASAMNSGSALVWDWKPAGWRKPAEKPTAESLDRLWQEMSGADAPTAHRAIFTLAAFPETALPLLRAKLKPAMPIPQEKLRRLIRDLDDDAFDRRDAAQKELAMHGLSAEAELRRALSETKSEEVRRSIKVLLEGLRRDWAIANAQTLQSIRGVWVLQRIGTPEARKQLEALAAGAPSERLTREAKDALAWLDRRARLAP